MTKNKKSNKNEKKNKQYSDEINDYPLYNNYCWIKCKINSLTNARKHLKPLKFPQQKHTHSYCMFERKLKQS